MSATMNGNVNFDAEKTANLLAGCTSSIFADMSFIDVQRVSAESQRALAANPEPASDDERCAAIDVLSPVSCRIELRITQGLRDRVVETLFGDAPDSVQKKTGEDTLLEMLNIIAGSFLSGYFGPGTPIQLELPRYLYFSEESAGQTVAKVFMDAEGQPLNISLNSVRYRY
jgi:hypothetical protein